jgi:hypothetical protein
LLPEYVDWVSDAIAKALRLMPSNLDVEIRIHLTRASECQDSAEYGEQSSENTPLLTVDDEAIGRRAVSTSEVLNHPAVSLLQGRPDIPRTLDKEIDSVVEKLSVTGERPKISAIQAC